MPKSHRNIADVRKKQNSDRLKKAAKRESESARQLKPLDLFTEEEILEAAFEIQYPNGKLDDVTTLPLWLQFQAEEAHRKKEETKTEPEPQKEEKVQSHSQDLFDYFDIGKFSDMLPLLN